MQTNFSNKLKALMNKQNITANELIKKLANKGFKYNVQSIYKWGNGTAEPTTDVIIALAKILHCDFAYMLDDAHTTSKRLTNTEAFLLRVFRNDIKFHKIITQVIDRNSDYKNKKNV